MKVSCEKNGTCFLSGKLLSLRFLTRWSLLIHSLCVSFIAFVIIFFVLNLINANFLHVCWLFSSQQKFNFLIFFEKRLGPFIRLNIHIILIFRQFIRYKTPNTEQIDKPIHFSKNNIYRSALQYRLHYRNYDD